MADTLETARREVDALLASLRSELDAYAAQRTADLDRREADLVRAQELLSQDGAVQAAYQQGQADERRRLLTLIRMQLEHLSKASACRVVLSTLRRMVEAPE